MSDTIWLVEGFCGEYSDRREWIVAFCPTEDEARRLQDQLVADDAELTEDERDTFSYDDDARRFSGKLKRDPQWRTCYGRTEYRMYPVERWRP